MSITSSRCCLVWKSLLAAATFAKARLSRTRDATTTTAVNGAGSTSMKRRYSRASPLKSLQTIVRLHTRVASAAALRGVSRTHRLRLSSHARPRQSPSIKLLSCPPSSSIFSTFCPPDVTCLLDAGNAQGGLHDDSSSCTPSQAAVDRHRRKSDKKAVGVTLPLLRDR